MIKFGSICSGIEAASKAWEPLGMSAAWFAQYDPEHKYKTGPDFPSAVLDDRWPDTINLGDMTQIAERIRLGLVEAPPLVVGGTPCQDFSVTGARQGLDGERGQLTLSYCHLADAIDEKRIENGEDPAVFVWENVPGVLSDKTNAFGAFIGYLAGEDCKMLPAGEKWTSAGCVYGSQRTVAWRVLDAQYFGLAQRRNRVFVVASAREGFDPTEVLFEWESLRRDIEPCRKTEKGTTAAAGNGLAVCCEEKPVAELDVVSALTAKGVGTCGADDNQAQAGHLVTMVDPLSVTVPYRMVAFGEYSDDDSASTMKARDYKDATDLAVTVIHGTQDPDILDNLAHTVGRNQGQENALVYAIPGWWINKAPGSGGNAVTPPENISPCLTACDRHGVAFLGDEPVVYSFEERGRPDGRLLEAIENLAYALTVSAGGGAANKRNICDTLTMTVRRLTPIECERLQGFPDAHTWIKCKRRHKMDPDEYEYMRRHLPGVPDEELPYYAPDAPRYKAIGNSMAVPVMAWIGERILKQLE